MDVTTATPSQIDEALYALYEKQGKAEHRLEMALTTLHSVAGDRPVRGRHSLSWEEALAKATEIAGRADCTAHDAQRALDSVEKAQKRLADLDAEGYPYRAEYGRRGGWTRAFLVQTTNGHVHSSMSCSTCNRGGERTRFAWMTEYSGCTEAEIVEAAGERACTVCYPSAPVNVLKQPTKMFGPDEIAAQKAREEREAKKAAAAAKKAANSITTPEGEKLYEDKDNSSYLVCKTLRTAEIAATDALLDLIVTQRQAKDPEFAFLFENGRTEAKRTLEITRHAWCLLRSIAAKKEQTFEETFQAHEKKAQAKFRKIQREWAKNPRR